MKRIIITVVLVIRQLREYLQACSEELSVDKLAEQMDTSLSWD